MTLAIIPRTVMTPVFLAYLDSVVLKEGGAAYTNDPDDRGGPTRYGVSQATARAAGYDGDMRSLSAEQATSIYWIMFWLNPGFDKVNTVSPDLAAFMFNIGVNCGQSWPCKWLQRLLNVLNQQGQTWPDMKVDGQIGLMTLGGLRAMLAQRGPNGMRVLLRGMQALAGVRYIELAEADASQEKYEFGWLDKRAFPADNPVTVTA